MTQKIKCPKCQEEIEITDAINHQAVEDALDEQREKYNTFLDKERKDWESKLEKEKQINQDLLIKKQQEITFQAQKDAENKLDIKLKLLESEKEISTKQNQELKTQLLELTKQIRIIQDKSEQKEIELQKQLNEERERIKEQTMLQLQESFRLKLTEKDQQLESVKRANEELTRKLSQGSQQTQGESLEIELEAKLKQAFPMDEIKEVPKGVNGADIIQIIKNNYGQNCGMILWESKNTKIYQPQWISKLKEDQRMVKADMAILATVSLPDKVSDFGLVDGVWVVRHSIAVALTSALRQQILMISQIKNSQQDKNSKMTVLYDYVASNEFRARIESIIESFGVMQEEIEKEKRYFNLKWAKQEKALRQIVDNTHGMYGDMQGIIGRELVEVEQLKLE